VCAPSANLATIKFQFHKTTKHNNDNGNKTVFTATMRARIPSGHSPYLVQGDAKNDTTLIQCELSIGQMSTTTVIISITYNYTAQRLLPGTYLHSLMSRRQQYGWLLSALLCHSITSQETHYVPAPQPHSPWMLPVHAHLDRLHTRYKNISTLTRRSNDDNITQ